MKPSSHDEFELSTGKKFYCCGLTACPDDDGSLVYGHDGTVEASTEWRARDPSDTVFTPLERGEIAAYFIGRWTAWAAQ